MSKSSQGCMGGGEAVAVGAQPRLAAVEIRGFGRTHFDPMSLGRRNKGTPSA
jgi:hypothetical protein